ncbi:MAG: HD domain-containing protein [Gemmatimonadaceae bacterium]|jgi:HD-GYP domain-containing protein (c-di-GMP phosphodiesterase class II)|nr:HD domain-containing protein [Gemmatimonadaceae bacterium]MCC6431137.1 HD domain-containing protein [Gemmatimonadaceae bacterium]
MHGVATPGEQGHEAQTQRAARAYVVALHGAVRAVRLYPVENSAVQKALLELGTAAERLMSNDTECELRRAGDYLFVNEIRLRLTLDNYAAVANVLGLLREAGIGGFSVVQRPAPRAWVVLLAFLQSPPLEYPEEERLAQLTERLAQSSIVEFALSAPTEDGAAGDDAELDQKERARQTYVRSLDVTREVMTSARLGRGPGLKRVKRAVQGIVDAILLDSSSMIGLTTLREFDEYTFVHSVNVCILSVALGRRLGLSKPQLLDLGLAALLHDIGKSKLPLELLNKRGALDDAERAMLQTHPWQGVLTLFSLPTGAGRPWRALTAAYEHHMRIDLSGYPKAARPRRLSLFSKIIAVADGFDAATTTRVYQESPWTPADVLRGMRDNPRLGLDPVIVKAFINLTGIYPAGTVVVLDTFELAIVLSANADPAAISRPLVRILSDAQGNRLSDALHCDLTERDDRAQYLRTIIRTEDPERHGIRIADYFA